MEIIKKVKRLVSKSVRCLHTEADAAPILKEFERELQLLKNSLPEGQQESLEDYSRSIWLLYDGFMTSVENEDNTIREMLQGSSGQVIEV